MCNCFSVNLSMVCKRKSRVKLVTACRPFVQLFVFKSVVYVCKMSKLYRVFFFQNVMFGFLKFCKLPKVAKC